MYINITCMDSNPQKIQYWLVVSPYPSENILNSSLGMTMMNFPTEWEKKTSHVPNHQPKEYLPSKLGHVWGF